MRASCRCIGEVLWELGFVGTLAVVGGLVFGAIMSCVALLFGGIAWLHADALFERRLPWVSWPAIVAFDGWIGWYLVRSKRDEMRLRRKLPGKIKLQALHCPLCGGPLRTWGGAFERCPPMPPHVSGVGEDPEGCFRLRCETCERDVWFAAFLDGTIRPHISWVLENIRLLEDGPDGTWR
jgi:hypothetical protein